MMKVLQRPQSQNNNKANDSTTSAESYDAAHSIETTKSPLDDIAASFQSAMLILHKPQNQYQSANYAQPTTNQTVKILRRPTQSTEPRNNGLRPRQPLKSLEQREQEYAEARLRIFGATKNPEDYVITKNANTFVTSTTSPSVPSTVPVPIGTPSSKLTSNTKFMKASNAVTNNRGQNLRNHYYHQQQQQQ